MLQISGIQRGLIWLTIVVGLLLAMPNMFYGTVERHNDAIVAMELGASSAELQEDRAAWPDWLPSGLVNLGLDLRGGAHLLAEVHVEEVINARMDSYWVSIRTALREARDQIGTIRRVPDTPEGELHIALQNPAAMPQAMQIVRALAQPIVSFTGVGTTDISVTSRGATMVIALTEDERIATNDRTMAQSLEIIRRRVDEAGTREPTIQRQGERRILIQVPGIGSASELKELIGQTAKLTFHLVVRNAGSPNENPGVGNIILPDLELDGLYYVLKETPIVTGEDLVDAQPAFDLNGAPSVTFRFNPAGARAFGKATAENIGRQFATVLDNEVITAPVIQEAIPGGTGQITGNFNVEQSTQLSILLRAGALPAGMDFLEERTIGPELGQDSIDAGKIACIIAFIAVLTFMFLSYGLFGLFANIALIINVGLIFGLLSLLGGTLTLPGIAGIVLTIGMAVDANVLIFERIREELKTAKGPGRAIELGYEKALSAILDANVTTFITAAILFVMGSGPVRGFSITLGLGILTSVFTAIYVTRLFVVTWYARRRPKTIEV